MSPIAWSCVSRNGVILAEAGEDDGSGHIIKAAKKINSKKATAGWEKCRSGPYRGLKFHLHEPAAEFEEGVFSEEILVWAFCCVYNPERLSEDYAKAFVTKIMYVSEPLRGMPWWRDGEVLSMQPSFAPTLQQQMDNVEHVGQMALLNQHVEEAKQVMHNNIESILERESKLEHLEEESSALQQMSMVFRKNTKKAKRFKMWQNAKHGAVVGTAITGAVGVAVIPPLIALL